MFSPLDIVATVRASRRRARRIRATADAAMGPFDVSYLDRMDGLSAVAVAFTPGHAPRHLMAATPAWALCAHRDGRDCPDCR